MAAKGLPDVYQKFILDAEEYLAKFDEILAKYQVFSEMTEHVARRMEDLGQRGEKALRSFSQQEVDSGRWDKWITAAESAVVLSKQATQQLSEPIADARRAFEENIDAMKRGRDDYLAIMRAIDSGLSNMDSGTEAINRRTDAWRRLTEEQQKMLQARGEVLATAAEQERLRAAAMEKGITSSILTFWNRPQGVLPGYPGAGELPPAWVQGTFPGLHPAPMDMGTRQGVTWGNALPGMGALPPGWVQPPLPFARPIGADVPPLMTGAYGGRAQPGAAGWAPLLALLRGAGGGIGGFGTFAQMFMQGGPGGGGPGDFTPGTAARAFANVANWVRGVWPAVHWITMLGNELLSTAGPAAVAAGMAGLVGLQGGQQVANRGQALFNVAQAFGPSTGQSLATFLRVPPTLQQMQSIYGSGEVYGIAGAGINAMRGGASGAFIQLGQNTLQMLSGAAADFNLALKGGLGKAAASIVQGGTGYLQQFGNVLGNVGKVLMGAAPNLPGVGSMLLTGLQAGTGGLADVVKALGGGLLPLLGFEAGARWGPTIVGGAASLAASIPFGLGGKLPAAARAATAADVAAGRMATTGALAKLGDVIPATEGGGLAGLLGGMTAPEIGGLAVAAIAINKALRGQTAAQQQYGALASSMTLGPSVGGGATNLVQAMSQLAVAGMAGGVPAAPSGVWWKGGGAFGNIGVLGGGISDLTRGGMAATGETGKAAVDLFTGNWSKGLGDLGRVWSDITGPSGSLHGLLQMFGIAGPAPSPQQAAFASLQKGFQTWSDVLGAPSQVKGIWAGQGGGALSTANALNVLMQSGVNINTAFDKSGQLTAKARQEIQNYVAGYQAMTGTVPGGAGGGTLAAINAVTVSGGLSQSKLSTTNAAFDQLTQAASAGAAGTAALTTLLGTLGTAMGVKGFTPSPLKATGAAAWTAFASTTQPSVMSQLGTQTDWLRTAQVLGAFGGGGTTQANMAKFLIGQALPSAQKLGPMGLADLSTIAQQYGMAPFTPGESAKQMEQGFHRFLKGGDTAKQYLAALTGTTTRVSNIPADAKQFVTQATGGFTQSLAQGIDLYGQGVQQAYMASFAKGGPSAPLSRQYAGLLDAAGYSPQSAGAVAAIAARIAGGTKAQIQAAAQTITVDVKAKIDPGSVADAGKKLSSVSSGVLDKLSHDLSTHMERTPVNKSLESLQQGLNAIAAHAQSATITYKAHVESPHIPDIPPKSFLIRGHVVMPSIPKIPDQSFTITGHVVMTGGGGGGPAQVSPYTPAGAAANLGFTMRRPGGQHGMFVPGMGSGDIVPAMLEPGELVVPRVMVGAGAVDHLRGKIPGFQSGGLVSPSTNFAGLAVPFQIALNNVTSTLVGDMQQLAESAKPVVQVFESMGASSPLHGGGGRGGPLAGQLALAESIKRQALAQEAAATGHIFAVSILHGIDKGLKDTPAEAKKIATSLVSQIRNEIAYARNVTSAAEQGQGYSSSGAGGGLLGTFSVPAPGSVPRMIQPGPGAKGFSPGAYNAYVSAFAAGTLPGDVNAGAAPQSVQQQMQAYLGTLRSFTKDLGTLRHEGLSKGLFSQLIGAGPVQGDALAQSILSGQGGVAAMNQLWSQTQRASQALGRLAAGTQYGGALTPTGGTFVGSGGVAITVNIGGSTSGGDLNLTTKQINELVTQIQKKLLQQNKRNRKNMISLT